MGKLTLYTCHVTPTSVFGMVDIRRHTELKKHIHSVKASALSQKNDKFFFFWKLFCYWRKVMKVELRLDLFVNITCQLESYSRPSYLILKLQRNTLIVEQIQYIFCLELRLKINIWFKVNSMLFKSIFMEWCRNRWRHR